MRRIGCVDQAPLDPGVVRKYRLGMPRPLTVTKARASFSKVARGVIKTRRPVVVKTPKGMVQIAPYAPAESLSVRPLDYVRLTDREIELSNTFGDTL
jgi:hypothetical protein